MRQPLFLSPLFPPFFPPSLLFFQPTCTPPHVSTSLEMKPSREPVPYWISNLVPLACRRQQSTGPAFRDAEPAGAAPQAPYQVWRRSVGAAGQGRRGAVLWRTTGRPEGEEGKWHVEAHAASARKQAYVRPAPASCIHILGRHACLPTSRSPDCPYNSLPGFFSL